MWLHCQYHAALSGSVRLMLAVVRYWFLGPVPGSLADSTGPVDRIDPKHLRARCVVHAIGQMLTIGGEVARQRIRDLLTPPSSALKLRYDGGNARTSMKKRAAGWRERVQFIRVKMETGNDAQNAILERHAFGGEISSRLQDRLAFLRQEFGSPRSQFGAISHIQVNPGLEAPECLQLPRELDGQLEEPSQTNAASMSLFASHWALNNRLVRRIIGFMTLYLHTTRGCQPLGFDKTTGWRVREGREFLQALHTLSALSAAAAALGSWSRDVGERWNGMRGAHARRNTREGLYPDPWAVGGPPPHVRCRPRLLGTPQRRHRSLVSPRCCHSAK